MQNIILKSCCLILFALAVLNVKGQRWQSFAISSNNHFENDEVDTAIIKMKKAISLFKIQEGLNKENLGYLYQNLAYYYEYINSCDKAITYYKKSEEILLPINENKLSEVYLGLGICYFTSNNYVNALEYFLKIENNLLLNKNTLTIDFFHLLINIQNCYSYLGDAENKLIYNLRLINHDLINEKQNFDYKLQALKSIGTLYFNKGEYLESIKYKIQLLGLLSKEQDVELYFNTLVSIGKSYTKLGDFSNSKSYLDKASDLLFINKGNISIKYKLNHAIAFSDLLQKQGQHSEALSILLKQEETTKGNIIDTYEYFDLLINIGFQYKLLGVYDKSIQYFEKVIDFFESKENLSVLEKDLIFGANQYLLESVLNDLDSDKFKVLIEKDFITVKGLENYINQAISTYSESHPSLIPAYDLVSRMFLRLQNYEKSLIFAHKSNELSAYFYDSLSLEFAYGLGRLGNIYYEIDDWEKVIKYFTKTVLIKEKLENPYSYGLAISYNNIAYSYQEIGDYTNASNYYSKRNKITLNHIQNSFKILTEIERLIFLEGMYRQIHSYNSFVNDFYNKLPKSIVESFNLTLASNGLLLSNNVNIKEAILSQNDTSLTNLFDNYIATSKQLDKAYEYTLEQRKINSIDIEQLQQKAESLERELVQRTSSFIDFPDYTLGKDDITKALGKNEVAIQFNSFPYHNGKEWTDSTMYVAYILNNKGVLQYIPLFKETTIAPLLEVFSNKEKANEVNQNLTLLHKFIWQPLQAHLKDIETIYYAPSGLLHKVPFVALKDSSNNYVGEQYHLQAVLSNRDIPKLKEQTQQSNQNLIALMGGANFDKFTEETIDENSIDFLMNMPLGSVLRNIDRSGWLYLKGTLKEVEKINKLAQIAGKTTLLKTGTDASEENFKQMVKEQMPGILHIATHGYYVPPPDEKPKSTLLSMDDNYFKSNDDPLLRSGILLSGANQKWVHKQNTDSDNDGILTALEISRLDLSNTELVVLSACETGLGDIKGSEGVYGLQRAFKMAGAKRQIVSLWQVPDKETAEMMELFYTYLFEDKLSYSESFNKAQNTMKKNYPNEPLKWAGFVLVE